MNNGLPSSSGDEDQYLVESGYQPQLHRRITAFASFAVSFSLMSVLVGVFAAYSFVLQNGGPFGIWTWPIIVCGQLLIALIFAEMAGRVPLTGSIYNWNAKLGSPTLAWQAGWIMIFSCSIGGVAATVALMTPLQSLLGITLDATQIKVVGVALILFQLLVNVYGVRLAAQINRYAVLMEITTILALSIGLVIAAALSGGFHVAPLLHIPSTPAPYWSAFLMSGLLGILTLLGFESPSDVSEETISARTIAPKSIIRSVFVSGALGFFFILILTLVIPNVAQITASSDPVSDIVLYYLGTFADKVFLACVVLAILAVSIVVIMYVSRLVFAIARDKRVAGSTYLSGVSSRGVPVGAAIFVAVIEIAVFLLASGQVALFAANAVLISLGYLLTVANFAHANRRLPEGSFSLGKWRPYVTSAAILWLIFEIGVLTIPSDFHLAAYISIGVVVAGLILQFLFGKSKSQSVT